jgi:K+-sensing histidine kinase KdpD
MSVRTWNAGTGQNTALFIMILFWALIILLAIAQTNWQWNAGTIIGLIFMIGILYTWVDISGTTAFYGFLAKVIIYNHVIIQVDSFARKF